MKTIFLFAIVSTDTACVCVSYSIMRNSLRFHGWQADMLLCPGNSPGKNTGVDFDSLLQIFLTQGSNPGLLHC